MRRRSEGDDLHHAGAVRAMTCTMLALLLHCVCVATTASSASSGGYPNVGSGYKSAGIKLATGRATAERRLCNQMD
ncbi:hypothetical protein JYU34_016184 [Plutella xylostella]|uniref:Secreted protein n=1 Tax=Plutella xylostella TaxID=51655 RepID=A0ABQ7Q5M8_PLUXY|nr:hypothetical protein JYU34_016184 [Plutella xylostella]